jgi:hypothetical protein
MKGIEPGEARVEKRRQEYGVTDCGFLTFDNFETASGSGSSKRHIHLKSRQAKGTHHV